MSDLKTLQTMQQLKGAKTFKHAVAGARFIFPDGTTAYFAGGQYITNKPDEIAELEKIANKPGTFIFTTDTPAADAAAQALQADLMKEAARAEASAGVDVAKAIIAA